MPLKEFKLVGRDLMFFLTGRADVRESGWRDDPRLYPLDWGYQLDRPTDYFAPFDASGIPLRILPAGLGTVYLPSRIACFACVHWNRLCGSGHRDHEMAFRAAADWFLLDREGAFYQSFDLLGLKAPWLTCINQGEGISVLLRAAQLTGDDRYRTQALRAAEWLHRPISKGGLKDALPSGHPFLEEYPNTIYRHVLNGCLYAMVGLWDLVESGMDPDGRHVTLLHDIADGIELSLHAWEVDDWTTYDYRGLGVGDDAPPNPNTMTYHVLEGILVGFLGERLRRSLLIEASGRWARSQQSLRSRVGAFIGKVSYRVAHGYKY